MQTTTRNTLSHCGPLTRPADRPRVVAFADRSNVRPLTDAQAAQVCGGSVEGDAALRAFLDRWFAAGDGNRLPLPGPPTFDAAF